MSASYRLTALALAAIWLAPLAARATDDGVGAVSSGPTLLGLCVGRRRRSNLPPARRPVSTHCPGKSKRRFNRRLRAQRSMPGRC